MRRLLMCACAWTLVWVQCAWALDETDDRWTLLCQAWSATTGAARCKVVVAVQDGDLASEQEAAPCVIAWNGADHAFAFTQGSLRVLVDVRRIIGVRDGVSAAVDRPVTSDPASAWRQEIPESPWPQLGLALRNSSQQWWKEIDPELGVLALKSCVKKDDGTSIVLLTGKNGWLELTFNTEAAMLIAATRRIESGPRVPQHAAIEWRMVFDSQPIAAEMLTLKVGDLRRVERLNDLSQQSTPKADEGSKDASRSIKQPNSEPKTVPAPKPDLQKTQSE